jgi:hypothetical protein
MKIDNPFDAPAVTPKPARPAGPIARAVALLIVAAITASLLAVLVGVAVRLWEWAL